MKTAMLVIDIIALILFSVSALLGMKISPWYVVAWIIIGMIDHVHREEE